MNITFNGKRHEVQVAHNGKLFLRDSEGKSYCNDNGCAVCAEGKDHRYRLDLPEEGFIDDQGNVWSGGAQVRFDESQSFGWWERKYHFFLESNTINPAEPVDIIGLRQQLISLLNDDKVVIKAAAIFGLS